MAFITLSTLLAIGALLYIGGLLPTATAQTTDLGSVSGWTADDYERAFDKIAADHSSSDIALQSKADAALSRALSSLPDAGINAQAAADFTRGKTTDATATTVVKSYRSDRTSVNLVLKNGIEKADGAQFFYSKDSSGQLATVKVPNYVGWVTQIWCDGEKACYELGYPACLTSETATCNLEAWLTFSYLTFHYERADESLPVEEPQIGITSEDHIHESYLRCRSTEYCGRDGLFYPRPGKNYSLVGRSYEGGSYGSRTKLLELPSAEGRAPEDPISVEREFTVTKVTSVREVDSISDYKSQLGDNTLSNYKAQQFMESICANPEYGDRVCSQSEKPDPTSEEAERFGPNDDPNASVGDPINLTTGNVYEIAEDLNVPGRGLSMQFARFYNSKDTYQGPLGYGWTYAYNSSLIEDTDGSVMLIDFQGARKRFIRFPDGSYRTEDEHDVLTKIRTARSRSAERTASSGSIIISVSC